MSGYSFSQGANADFKDIVTYTQETWGKDAALKYIDTLQDLLGQLADCPKMGASRNDLAEGLRSFQYQSHVVYYLEESAGIVVARVLHERAAAYWGILQS
jgi:toxin ParE1/3/4